MLRSHHCGALRLKDAGNYVTLCGWVQVVRDKGGMVWVDLRDRYGVTQLRLEEGKTPADILEKARTLGREFVVRACGTVVEREAKSQKIDTGDIELDVDHLEILNEAKLPPFKIQDDTDGGDELRMKYRYLDIRRPAVRNKLVLRHKLATATRNYLDELNFTEVETPVLIKSTPEGARDFVVPSRLNPTEFYALPQSPQTFKQLLMVAGMDRYFQIVKCFRDEDLRADRQPEFTQIDCEMSFVTQEDVLQTFEGLVKHLFEKVKGVQLPAFERMSYADAMSSYGNDKPDLRFGMKFCDLTELAKGHNFPVFEQAEKVLAINASGAANYTRKQLDELTAWVKRPQIGAKGLVYARINADGSVKSSVDKFYNQEALQQWAEACKAKPGDLLLVLSGNEAATQKQLSELRLEMGNRLELRDSTIYKPLWVLDFPLLERDEEAGRWHAMHHPFTSPLAADLEKVTTDPGAVRANAYDMVINGVEVGGGSIRIHNRELQEKMFELLDFTPEEARAQFGFLMDAFEYGAPPHGGIAFGFDRLCALMGGSDSIRDYIAFPKNTSGRDVMIDSPSAIAQEQLEELQIKVVPQEGG
jgi:aspartyl-tRNA synthetase